MTPIFTRLLKLIRRDENGCWTWCGTVNGAGYGTIGLGTRCMGKDFVHRVSYRIFIGQIPDGMVVCHRCDVKRCVNPLHLFVGTYKDNSDDMAAKGRAPVGDSWKTERRTLRQVKGELHGMAKLTEPQVLEVRRQSSAGKSKAEISNAFGVCRATIRNIVNGNNWTHLK